MIVLMALLAARIALAQGIGSAVIGKVEELKDVQRLTHRSKRGNTYLDGSGSGFFVATDGKVITNHHVIDGAAEIVVVHRGIAYAARVAKKNKELDLALLEFDGLPYIVGETIDFNKFSTPKFGCVSVRRRDVDVGEEVTVVGYPHIAAQGLEAKVTRGIVNSKTGFKGEGKNFQIDATVRHGNSGGPVFDTSGQLLGVAVAVLYGEGIVSYAINIDTLLKFLGKDVVLKMADGIEAAKKKGMIKNLIDKSVLILTYKAGARALPPDVENARVGNEIKANLAKTILAAQLLKVRKEWKELKELSDGLIKSGLADEEIVSMNNIAREELGEHLVIYAEVEGADVKARVKPICGIRDAFVQCEEVFALDGGTLKRGFPVKAELTYYTPQGALWKGMIDEIYDWRGTREIRVKLNKVIIK